VSPEYFETLGIPIVRGRAFSDADRAGSPDVAIVNETFARALWPNDDPIGRVIRNEERVLTVVGVARDSRYRTLGESPRNFIYVALAQRYMSRLTLMVRAPNTESLGAAMRRMVADVDRSLPVLDARTLEEQIGVSLFPQRIALWVAGSLGIVALLLALLGIYGVTALSVAQRTREIGVRTALGARTGQIRGLVLRQGATLAGIGVVIGALLAAGITRALGAMLYGVPSTDAFAFAGAASILMLAALAASWIPARRATLVDPVVALRSE
jgi:predicted permease